MTPEEEIRKGQQAKALYDEILAPYFAEMDNVLFETFKQAKNDELPEIRRQSRTLDGMKAHIENFIETGKIAQYELEN